MRYKRFIVEHYRAIVKPVEINIAEQSLIPLIGVNECGKTTVLQAIFAFDAANDKEYEGRHLDNTINLYQTTDRDPLVTAEIEGTLQDITYAWDQMVRKLQNPPPSKNPQQPTPAPPPVPEFPINARTFKGSILITRNLNTKHYTISECSGIDTGFQHLFAKQILQISPYILYNDDFQDRPPSSIKIPNPRPSDLSGWLAIYERLFETTNPSYSLFTAAALEDDRRKASIVSDVQSTLNATLTKAWKTFHLDRTRRIQVKLELSSTELKIKIVEKLGDLERFFEIVDRSKGFLWFYNFVMKLEFNPKHIDDSKNTVYLLDEPGSYLHPGAQENLCTKLKAISKKHGKVIFCTHSHHLLDPEQIPLNSILIVSKGSNKSISLIPLPQFPTSRERVTPLQPVYEALQVASAELEGETLPVIAVEGIYDKYAIKMFMPRANEIRLYPGTSADSILKNIQTLNAFGRIYAAIWDNDPEGRKVRKQAETLFGSYEARRFDVLPSREGGKDRRMEQMFDPVDMQLLRDRLTLPTDSTYESILATLYYTDPNRRDTLISKIGDNTKTNFAVLQKVVDKLLQRSRELHDSE